LDFHGGWALGFDTTPFVVGHGVPPVGYSSHLGVEYGFAIRPGVVVASTIVGPAKGQATLEDMVHSWILSFI
jgi:hypothetical protein